MNSETIFVLCDIQKGMFTNEYAVEFAVSGGEKNSLFADKSLITINGSPKTGYLKARIIERQGLSGLVLLPSETFETGSRWVTVPNEKLQDQPI